MNNNEKRRRRRERKKRRDKMTKEEKDAMWDNKMKNIALKMEWARIKKLNIQRQWDNLGK